MQDCSGKEIQVLDVNKLRVLCNRHSNCDGTAWGWIEGTNNAVWSDNSFFNRASAVEFVLQQKEIAKKAKK